ncbi:hypothetical protein [Thermus tengchongensis]|uniref:hypothetical protein n=1 Tax=Thermus tengchongensis TaxID=1214928 RepID=UPI001432E011|nr:hypothetical protein [Thermus tengchongensis]
MPRQNPAPPGGGDLTLGAPNYTRTFRTTSTFTDVPTGNLSVDARVVWSDALTAWEPSPSAWRGVLYSYLPITVRVQYSIVPGTLTFSASGFPADGSATVSAGPYSATLGGGGSQSVQALPGRYSTSASPEVSVSRSGNGVSWTEIYTLQSVSPAEVAVKSYETSTVSATYSGPLPGTLCEDGSCRQVPPGAYTAPASQLLRTYTQTRTESCPSGYTGSITVTETWEDWRVWSPGVVGVSSRGTAGFTSRVESRLVNTSTQNNCELIREPPEPPTQTTQSTDPSNQSTNPSNQTTDPSNQSTDPSQSQTLTQPTDEPNSRLTDEPTKPTDEPTKPTDELTTQTNTDASQSNGNEDDGGYSQVNIDLQVSLIGPGHLSWLPQPMPGKGSSTASGRKHWSERRKEEIARSLLAQRSLW